MEYEAKDVKEAETCGKGHLAQYIEADAAGRVWQYCTGCDRKLSVR